MPLVSPKVPGRVVSEETHSRTSRLAPLPSGNELTQRGVSQGPRRAASGHYFSRLGEKHNKGLVSSIHKELSTLKSKPKNHMV